MSPHYDETYCLGINNDQFSPDIECYASWDELAHYCRTGKIRAGGIPKKDSLPGVTYKGDYGNYREQSHFVGKRSPYVVIDIDFDEKKNGYIKSSLRDNPAIFKRVTEDLNMIKDELSPDGYFFLKRSTSGCGLHIVLRVIGLPEDLHGAASVEKMIFKHVQAAINMLPLHFKGGYMVDDSLAAVTRVFFLSHDPELIYDPSFPPVQMKEEWLAPPVEPWEGVRMIPGAGERELFESFADKCLADRIRLQDSEIFNLSILYHQLWPLYVDGVIDGDSQKRFKELFTKFNKERSRERPDRGYLDRAYRHGKETNEATGNHHRIGMKTLYDMAGMDRPVDNNPFSNFPDFMQDFLKD